MACKICDDKGWVCEAHRRPFATFSKRADACSCSHGVPCACNKDPLHDKRHGGEFVPVDDAAPPKPTVH